MTRIWCMVTCFAIAGCLSGCVLPAAFNWSKEGVNQSTQNGASIVRQPALLPPAVPPVGQPVPAAAMQVPTTTERPLPADVDQSQRLSKIILEGAQLVDPLPKSQAPKAAIRAKPKAAMTAAVAAGGPLVRSTCAKIENKLASVSFDTCWGLALSQTGYYSVNGVPILHKMFPPKPGITRSSSGSIVSGVTSRGATPVPPVKMIARESDSSIA